MRIEAWRVRGVDVVEPVGGGLWPGRAATSSGRADRSVTGRGRAGSGDGELVRQVADPTLRLAAYVDALRELDEEVPEPRVAMAVRDYIGSQLEDHPEVAAVLCEPPFTESGSEVSELERRSISGVMVPTLGSRVFHLDVRCARRGDEDGDERGVVVSGSAGEVLFDADIYTCHRCARELGPVARVGELRGAWVAVRDAAVGTLKSMRFGEPVDARLVNRVVEGLVEALRVSAGPGHRSARPGDVVAATALLESLTETTADRARANGALRAVEYQAGLVVALDRLAGGTGEAEMLGQCIVEGVAVDRVVEAATGRLDGVFTRRAAVAGRVQAVFDQALQEMAAARHRRGRLDGVVCDGHGEHGEFVARIAATHRLAVGERFEVRLAGPGSVAVGEALRLARRWPLLHDGAS